MNRINREQGFTLLEIIVVLAVSGILVAAFASPISSILFRTSDQNNRVTAVSSLQSAAMSIDRDVQMALSTDLESGETGTGEIRLMSLDGNGDIHEVIYTVSGNGLLRQEYINETIDSEETISRYITGATFYRLQGGDPVIKVSLSSSGAEMSGINETGEYYVHLRSAN